jgi:hypothetical protein
MKFKSRGSVKGNPEVAAKVRIDPLRFNTNIAGSFECNIGAINGYVGDIRIRFAIPFMKPRRRLPVVATVGGFPISLKPFNVQCGTKGMQIGGVVGPEGIGAALDARVTCCMEGEMDGDLPVSKGHFHIDLDDVFEK